MMAHFIETDDPTTNAIVRHMKAGGYLVYLAAGDGQILATAFDQEHNMQKVVIDGERDAETVYRAVCLLARQCGIDLEG